MKGLAVVFSIFLLSASGAFAQGAAPQSATGQSCEAQSAAKNLKGAAKSSFVNKCKRDACEAKAVGSNGKPLSGAAKTSFMKKCEAGA